MPLFRDPWFINSILAICSVSALLVAFLFEHVAGLEPCDLCWYQRYIYFVILIISVFNLLTFRRYNVLKFSLPLCTLVFCSGTGLAIYHLGVEQGWFASGCATVITGDSIEEIRSSVLATTVVRCDEVSWSFLQLSMAGWNAIASALLTFITGFTIISLRYKKR